LNFRTRQRIRRFSALPPPIPTLPQHDRRSFTRTRFGRLGRYFTGRHSNSIVLPVLAVNCGVTEEVSPSTATARTCENRPVHSSAWGPRPRSGIRGHRGPSASAGPSAAAFSICRCTFGGMTKESSGKHR